MERHPLLISLLDDDRVYGIPETLLGPDFILEMTDGHVRGGDTPWHGLIKAQARSASAGTRAGVSVYVTMRR